MRDSEETDVTQATSGPSRAHGREAFRQPAVGQFKATQARRSVYVALLGAGLNSHGGDYVRPPASRKTLASARK
ncbi:hypothetical protein MRX96_053525 [Rhipicephalus microplus]